MDNLEYLKEVEKSIQKKYKKKEYIIIVPNWFGKLY